ncbi:MAG: FliO/MopB family protein [Verrucomicrobia bacterium]|nr:FliO/MopB family protein [Verrucomicrobiota bacterium]
MKACRCFGLAALLIVPIAVAQAAGLEPTNSTSQAQPSSVSLLEAFLRMVAALVFVVSILILGAWFFKRSRFLSMYRSGPAQLQVLESRSLGYRNSLLVVGYHQHRFLLAATATGVSLLSQLPDAAATAAPSSDRTSFPEHLDAAQSRKE